MSKSAEKKEGKKEEGKKSKSADIKAIKRIRELVPIKSPDKNFMEIWTPGRDLINIVKSYRMIIFSKPNCGKTLTMKNIIAHADPPFNAIYQRSNSYSNNEYADCKAILLKHTPDVNDWIDDTKINQLFIYDDAQFDFDKDEEKKFADLICFASSHKNISVIVATQRMTTLPTLLRTVANFMILWKPDNLIDMDIIAKRVNIKTSVFSDFVDKQLTGDRDSLWIDLTNDTPHKYRKNGYIPVTL